MDRETITEAVAGAWCHPKNKHKVMDVDLANVIIDNICIMFQKAKIESLERMVVRGGNKDIQRLLELAKNKLAIMMGTAATIDEPDHVVGG